MARGLWRLGQRGQSRFSRIVVRFRLLRSLREGRPGQTALSTGGGELERLRRDCGAWDREVSPGFRGSW
jgi:hypothetical protein